MHSPRRPVQVLQDLWLRQRFTAILVTLICAMAAFPGRHVLCDDSARTHRCRCPIDIARPRNARDDLEPATPEIATSCAAHREIRSQ